MAWFQKWARLISCLCLFNVCLRDVFDLNGHGIEGYGPNAGKWDQCKRAKMLARMLWTTGALSVLYTSLKKILLDYNITLLFDAILL